jgi:putative SOS response-associated peptidase YedK
MCGRFTLSTPPEKLAQLFELPEVPKLEAHYNIAPTQRIAAVRQPDEASARQLVHLHWGLIPFWAKDRSGSSRMINARAETVATTPAFRAAFQQRRCLVVADGFYEWQRVGKGKQPFYIRMEDESPFAFAGLWEHWEGSGGEVVESCTLITTTPNDLVRPIHNRMPVILSPEHYAMWLDPRMQEAKTLQQLLQPFPDDAMTAYPVSQMVNIPANDDPQNIAPLAA